MAPFPDNLPPEGLDAVYKLLIYYGLVFVLATALTTWLITRRRSYPKAKIVESTTSIAEPAMNVTDTLNLDNTADRLASLIVEEYAHEGAIKKLNDLKDQLSNRTYDKINIHYNDRLADIKMEIDTIQDSMIQPEAINPLVEEKDEASIDEDLEKQLLDLEADDTFLKPRKKKTIEEVFDTETPSAQSSTPVATPVSPPPQTKTTTAPPPQTKKVAPIPPPPMKSENSASAMPPAPAKKASPPPPPGKNAAPPQAVTPPKASLPKTSEPLSAAQPMKVQSEQDDTMFAKSTSIAALRMDMLRELARLKKLIPEDQEKD